jgi:CHC2 zinc finger/Toprim domain
MAAYQTRRVGGKPDFDADTRAVELARSVPIEIVVRNRGLALKRQGREMVGPCPRCGGRDRFAIHFGKQVWNCRGCGVGDDVIGLLMHIDECDFSTAVATLSGAVPEIIRCKSRRSPATGCGDASDAEGVARALRVWDEAKPLGSLAMSYLTRPRSQGGRGLVIPDILLSGEVLRFHSSHWWGCQDKGSVQVPALLALFRDICSDEPRAIWRRRLTPDARSCGVPRFMGPKAGCAIKFTDHADVEQGVHVGEGPETVLAAMMRDFSPAWSLGDAAGVEGFPVLGGVEVLTIIVDRDENGAGQMAAAECFDRWTAAERQVRCVVPDEVDTDMNDIVGRA